MLTIFTLYFILFIFSAHYHYDGCWNGYDYDCCRNRRSNFFYPSLVKPLPYYYRCVGKSVVYGRCAANLCVTTAGTCGKYDNDPNQYWCCYKSDKLQFKCVYILEFTSGVPKYGSLGEPNILHSNPFEACQIHPRPNI